MYAVAKKQLDKVIFKFGKAPLNRRDKLLTDSDCYKVCFCWFNELLESTFCKTTIEKPWQRYTLNANSSSLKSSFRWRDLTLGIVQTPLLSTQIN